MINKGYYMIWFFGNLVVDDESKTRYLQEKENLKAYNIDEIKLGG